MPTKHPPSTEEFQEFMEQLEVRGFQVLSTNSPYRSFKRHKRKTRPHRDGGGVGLIFSRNGLDVVVRTTQCKDTGLACESDEGWVFISDGKDTLYSSRPYHRTKNFLSNLLWGARIARSRVRNRPHCDVCGAWMHIAQGKGIKSRYWKCSSTAHKMPTRKSFDLGLPEDALAYLKKKRKKQAKYQAKLKKEGKSFGAALEKRIGKKIRKPQNAVPRH